MHVDTDALVNYIESGDCVLQDEQPIPIDKILSGLPYGYQKRVRVDESSGEIIVPDCYNQNGSVDARVLDTGSRVVMSGKINLNAQFVIISIIQMKGWKRIEVRGNKDFCREEAWQAVIKELQLADEGLRDYVNTRSMKERMSELLVAIPVYLLVLVIGLAGPFFTISLLSGGIVPLVQDNVLYALSILIVCVVVIRMMARWISN